MAVLLASTFSLIFPLVAPAAVLLLLLTLIGVFLMPERDAMTVLTLSLCSPPLPHRLRLRTDTLANRRASAALAHQAFRHATCVPAAHPRSRPAQP